MGSWMENHALSLDGKFSPIALDYGKSLGHLGTDKGQVSRPIETGSILNYRR